MQSVLADMDPEKLATKIAGRCGAASSEGAQRIDKHASKQVWTGGEGKEVSLVKLEPLDGEVKERTGGLKSFRTQHLPGSSRNAH